MKTYIQLTLIAVLSFVLTGCMIQQEDFELNRSIFVEDELNPGLPVYSEWGYNTFGIYVDRTPFVSNDYQMPVKFIVNFDTLNIMFNGVFRGRDASLKFSIKGYSPKDYDELSVLNDVHIDLKGENVKTYFTYDEKTYQLNIMDGEIHFKKFQNLMVDKEFAKSILSGKFNFRALKEKEPMSFANGRFDLGVGYDNFYNY